MKVKVHIKVFGLLLFLILSFFTGLFLLKNSEDRKINMLLEDEGDEQSVLLDNTLKQVGESLDSFTKDYSLWSEMVKFIRSPQDKWAEANIEPGLSTFNIQAICIYDSDFSLKYSKSFIQNELPLILPLHDRKFRKLIRANRFYHFFANTPAGILEIRSASVHPSQDASRKTRPEGYLFTARLWSPKHLKEISKLISARISVSDQGNEIHEVTETEDHFVIKLSKVLLNWNGQFTAVLKAKKEYPIYDKVYNWANLQYQSLVLFSAVMLLVISTFLFLTVNKPLNTISRSLRTGRTDLLRGLKKRNDEFGELALLMLEFHRQKMVLEEEICKKELAETELRKMKDGLEELVEKRTAELAGVNNILEQEISERKRVEAGLNLYHKKLKDSVFGNPDAVNFTRLSDNVVLDANDNFFKLTGYSRQEIIGKSTVELGLWIKPSDRDALIERLLINGSESNYESEFLSKGGILKTLSISATIIEYREERAIIFVIRDISERKRIEDELIEYKKQLEVLVEQRTSKLNELNARLSKQIEKFEEADNKITDQHILFSTLLDTIPIPILIQDIDKRYTECNHAAEEFFGIQKEELAEKYKGRSLIKDALRSADSSENLVMNTESVSDEAPLTFESKVMMGNGVIKDVVIYRSLFKRSNNLPGGIIAVLFDISDRKRIENELTKTLQTEKELNELKSRFISSASHQFRTPLATIQSSVDLLDMYGRKWSDDKYNGQLSIIQNQIEQMTELLNDILTVSKNEMEKVKFNPSRINFYELCSTIFNEIKSRGKEYHSFVFNYNIEEKELYLDKKLLKYILNNLLDNALKYTVYAGEIRLEIDKEENNLVILVSDQGLGIPNEELRNLFTAFHRSVNVSNLPGTGLGLSIVKKAVELQNGEIACHSILNQGTTFTVMLPLAVPMEKTGS